MSPENKRPAFFEEMIEEKMKQTKIEYDRLKELISVLSYLSSETSDCYRSNRLYGKRSYCRYKLKDIYSNNKEWIYDYAMSNKREPLALNETVNCLVNIIGNDSIKNIINVYNRRKGVNICVVSNLSITLYGNTDVSYKNLSNKLFKG